MLGDVRLLGQDGGGGEEGVGGGASRWLGLLMLRGGCWVLKGLVELYCKISHGVVVYHLSAAESE